MTDFFDPKLSAPDSAQRRNRIIGFGVVGALLALLILSQLGRDDSNKLMRLVNAVLMGRDDNVANALLWLEEMAEEGELSDLEVTYVRELLRDLERYEWDAGQVSAIGVPSIADEIRKMTPDGVIADDISFEFNGRVVNLEPSAELTRQLNVFLAALDPAGKVLAEGEIIQVSSNVSLFVRDEVSVGGELVLSVFFELTLGGGRRLYFYMLYEAGEGQTEIRVFLDNSDSASAMCLPDGVDSSQMRLDALKLLFKEYLELQRFFNLPELAEGAVLTRDNCLES